MLGRGLEASQCRIDWLCLCRVEVWLDTLNVQGRGACGPPSIPYSAEQPSDSSAKSDGSQSSMQLGVDANWYVRYRSATNPDFGATFAGDHTCRTQAPVACPRGSFQQSPGQTTISVLRTTSKQSPTPRHATLDLSSRLVRAFTLL